MKPASKRALSLLASAGFLIAAFVVHALLIKPAYGEVKHLRGELKAKDRFLKEQSVAISKVNDLILQYQGAGPLRDAIALSYPLGEDLPSVFNQLKTLATVHGLAIKVFGVKPLAFRELIRAPLVKRTGVLELSLELAGPYQSFKRFIEGVETNIRVMDVKRFSIERLSTPESNFFSYNVTIHTYYGD